MIFLILSVLCSSSIYIIFKLLNRFRIKLFPVILINYIIASFTGYLLSWGNFSVQKAIVSDWFVFAIIIGILFISIFYLIGISTIKTGITLTTISSKMSVIFPMLFSIFYYSEKLYSIKVIGILIALLAIFFLSINGEEDKARAKNLIFPLILFVGMGILDSIVKYTQEEYLQNTGVIESSTVTFLVAAAIGLFIQFVFNFRKIRKYSLNSVFFGILLGLVNFGSLYFILLALNSKFLDSSVIFALNNTAIIMISVLLGKYIFHEKLSLINWVGVFSSILAIVLLSINF